MQGSWEKGGDLLPVDGCQAGKDGRQVMAGSPLSPRLISRTPTVLQVPCVLNRCLLEIPIQSPHASIAWPKRKLTLTRRAQDCFSGESPLITAPPITGIPNSEHTKTIAVFADSHSYILVNPMVEQASSASVTSRGPLHTGADFPEPGSCHEQEAEGFCWSLVTVPDSC
jgi:hypothetical protein